MINEFKYHLYRIIAFFFKYLPHGPIRRKLVYRFRFYLIQGYLAKYQLKSGDFVVDGGAFDGFFTFYAAKIVGNKGKVIAFEPDIINYKNLIEQKIKNKFKNVIIINKGLWSEEKILKLSTRSSDDNMEASFFSGVEDNNTIDVPVAKLDDELKKLGIEKVDFIKMDIEGAEIEAVKGAKNLLTNYSINLAIASYHIVNGEKTCYKLEELLNKLGYKTLTSFPEHLTTYAFK